MAHVKIERFNADTQDGHVEYFMKVVYRGKEWGLWKRFRDFDLLDSSLLKFGYHTKTFRLPRKIWWASSKKVSIIVQRQRDLQKYLDELLSEPGAAEVLLVRDFLCLDVIPDSVDIEGCNHTDFSDSILATLMASLIQVPFQRPTSRTRGVSMSMKLTNSSSHRLIQNLSPITFPRSDPSKFGVGMLKGNNRSASSNHILASSGQNKIMEISQDDSVKIDAFPRLSCHEIVSILGGSVDLHIACQVDIVFALDNILEAAASLSFASVHSLIEHFFDDKDKFKLSRKGRVDSRPKLQQSPIRPKPKPTDFFS